ncbi:hypothetical protein [Clostridium botulinum]
MYIREESEKLWYSKIELFKGYDGIPKDILNKYEDRFVYFDIIFNMNNL